MLPIVYITVLSIPYVDHSFLPLTAEAESKSAAVSVPNSTSTINSGRDQKQHQEAPRHVFLSNSQNSGGFAYLHDFIDDVPTKETSLVLSMWIKLLPLKDDRSTNARYDIVEEAEDGTNSSHKQSVHQKRILFTTDDKNVANHCFTESDDDDFFNESTQCASTPTSNKQKEKMGIQVTDSFMTLSIVQNSFLPASTATDNDDNDVTTKQNNSFKILLEYSIYSPNSKDPKSSCRRLETEVFLSNLVATEEEGFGQWTQIGLSIIPQMNQGNKSNSSHRNSNPELISIHMNGSTIANYTEKNRQRRSRKKRVKAFQPLSTKDLKTPKTYIGRSFPPQNDDHSMEGYLASMAFFINDNIVSDTVNDGSGMNEVNELMKKVYDEGLSYRGHKISLPLSPSKDITPSLMFTFENTNSTHFDSVSKLSEVINGQHGIIRRNIYREPYVHLGEKRYTQYRDGAFTPTELSEDAKEKDRDQARIRRTHVRNAMKHAWEGYRIYAWGSDELKPLSKRGFNNFGGMGVTLVDSLSTLWLMDMKDEFWEARDWIRDNWSLDHIGAVSVFETTIRSLGGLLSAYDLSGDKLFLDKADDLGSRLSNAFLTSSGIPFGETILNDNYSFNTNWHRQHAILSELGTLQLEFRYLAAATGKKRYADLVENVIEQMEKLQPSDGLFPIFIHNNRTSTPRFDDLQKVTFGAMGDSFYEYLLKTWLQSGRTETRYRSMYDRAMNGVHMFLVQQSKPSGLTYLADLENRKTIHKMDHLVCFMGGNLALGAYTNPDGLQSPRAQRDLRLGKALAYTCYQMYAKFKSGIAPEFVTFNTHRRDFTKSDFDPFYILRPETVESFFILNKLTGDPVYREWGWEVFQAIEEHCRSDVAFASLKDVDDPGMGTSDKMESYFLAETLKYLYLLQDPDTEIDLDKYVFNTEAHPLRVFQKW